MSAGPTALGSALRRRLAGLPAGIDWTLLLNAMLGQFLVGLSYHSFGVSMPTIARSMNASIQGITWAFLSYQLAQVSLSILFGRLGDLYGRERVYAAGFLTITLSSVACGLSQNTLQLIFFRFLQGVGCALIQANGRVLAMEAMPPQSPGKAVGLMVMAFNLGTLLGPSAGGIIVDLSSWRSVFFALSAIGVIGVLLCAAAPRKARSQSRAAAPDYLGSGLFVSLMIVMTLLLDAKSARHFGLSRGWLSLAGAAIAAALWRVEMRSAAPMIQPALFKIAPFTFGILSLLTFTTVMSMNLFLMPLYLQEVLRLSPTFLGLIFLIQPVFTMPLSIVSGHIGDRLGDRLPSVAGACALLVAVAVGCTLGVHSPWTWGMALIAAQGIGIGLFNSTTQMGIIKALPVEYRGFGNGMIPTVTYMGFMLGTSIAGAIVTRATDPAAVLNGATSIARDPAAFVSAMSLCFKLGIVVTLAALLLSFTKQKAETGEIDPRAFQFFSDTGIAQGLVDFRRLENLFCDEAARLLGAGRKALSTLILDAKDRNAARELVEISVGLKGAAATFGDKTTAAIAKWLEGGLLGFADRSLPPSEEFLALSRRALDSLMSRVAAIQQGRFAEDLAPLLAELERYGGAALTGTRKQDTLHRIKTLNPWRPE